jgi:hypothetical protein
MRPFGICSKCIAGILYLIYIICAVSYGYIVLDMNIVTCYGKSVFVIGIVVLIIILIVLTHLIYILGINEEVVKNLSNDKFISTVFSDYSNVNNKEKGAKK